MGLYVERIYEKCTKKRTLENTSFSKSDRKDAMEYLEAEEGRWKIIMWHSTY